MFQELTVKTALHKIVDSKLPYQRDLNIYRGCMHHCQYCYALYSHKYLEQDDFFGKVFVKENIVELLEKKLRSKRRAREVINLGGVTDSYQFAAEKTYQLMPQILKLFIKYKQPCIISTKSDLILRDIALWDELAREVPVSIGVSLITTDEKLQAIVEPGAPRASARLEIFRQFAKTKVRMGRHCMPVLPYLTDSEANISKLLHYACKYRVQYFLAGSLNLGSQTRQTYFAMLEKHFPTLLPRVKKLYKGMYIDKKYADSLRRMVRALKSRYGFVDHYTLPEPVIKKTEMKQLSLFAV